MRWQRRQRTSSASHCVRACTSSPKCASTYSTRPKRSSSASTAANAHAPAPAKFFAHLRASNEDLGVVYGSFVTVAYCVSPGESSHVGTSLSLPRPTLPAVGVWLRQRPLQTISVCPAASPTPSVLPATTAPPQPAPSALSSPPKPYVGPPTHVTCAMRRRRGSRIPRTPALPPALPPAPTAAESSNFSGTRNLRAAGL